ncbi:hypothetical protein A9306_09765 [Moraxella atlantae]|uniref:Uncharacterized protein n=1 Tax=Faucicola atlantae TaxID=34059 RepID=A0A1B8QBN7_9GAMM|nr:hypothetical protein A9306_09765 [Moraxella atlantae]
MISPLVVWLSDFWLNSFLMRWFLGSAMFWQHETHLPDQQNAKICVIVAYCTPKTFDDAFILAAHTF